MKNLLMSFGLLSVVTFGLFSCSNDDDSSSDTVDQEIYGTWTSKAVITNGNYNPVNECNELIKYRIKSNGTFEVTTYIGDNFNDCNEDATKSGKWEYKGGNKYLLYTNAEETLAMNDEAAYTYVLNVNDDTDELNWYKLSDYSNDSNTFVIFYD